MGAPRLKLIAACGIAGAIFVGCGKDSAPPTSPTTPNQMPASSCAYTVSGAPADIVSAAGSEFTLSVATGAGCSWTATTTSLFITAAGVASGNGSGSVRFTIAPNPATARQGFVTVEGETVTVGQAAGTQQSCEYRVSPTAALVAAGGTDVSVDISVVSGANCVWTADSTDTFVAVKQGNTGIGNGKATLSVASNAGTARAGSASIAGQPFGIAQDGAQPTGPACVYNVFPTDASVLAVGNSFTISVKVIQGTNCTWVAQSQSPFLTISAGSAGVGTGSVKVWVTQNPDVTSRSGTIIVAGQTVVLHQPGATQPAPPSPSCSFLFHPAQGVAQASGEVLNVTVTPSAPSCAWTAQSQSPFITVTAGASGVGTSVVSLSVAFNSGAARSGSALIAGQTYTVTQGGNSSACQLVVEPASLSGGASGFSAMHYIRQTAGKNCPWQAQPSASWIMMQPPSGTIPDLGYSPVDIFVEANPGPARTGTVTIGNAVLSVSQAGALPSNTAMVLRSDSGGITLIGSQFQVTADQTEGSVQFNAVPGQPGTNFFLRIGAPAGQPLAAGYYSGATRFAGAANPGLDFAWNGQGCNDLTGRFYVSEATWGPGNTLVRFHAAFEQHCNNWSSAVRGEIWLDAQGSTTPPPIALPLPPASPTTFFTYQSDPGDLAGNGGSASYTLANAVFVPSAGLGLVTIGTRSPLKWSLLFRAPVSGPLMPGTYINATESTAPSATQLSVHVGFSCTTITGKFTVLEAVYGPGGEVYRFRATFEQHCNGAMPALRGEIFIVADPWR